MVSFSFLEETGGSGGVGQKKEETERERRVRGGEVKWKREKLGGK